MRNLTVEKPFREPAGMHSDSIILQASDLKPEPGKTGKVQYSIIGVDPLGLVSVHGAVISFSWRAAVAPRADLDMPPSTQVGLACAFQVQARIETLTLSPLNPKIAKFSTDCFLKALTN